MNDKQKLVSPRAVLAQVSNAIPNECRANIVIIGSLAAGYIFFRNEDTMTVRTKDVDCLLTPRLLAVRTGKAVMEQLFAHGWRFHPVGKWKKPGSAAEDIDELPAPRFEPPEDKNWFIELLSAPDPNTNDAGQKQRIVTSRETLCCRHFVFSVLQRTILNSRSLESSLPVRK